MCDKDLIRSALQFTLFFVLGEHNQAYYSPHYFVRCEYYSKILSILQYSSECLSKSKWMKNFMIQKHRYLRANDGKRGSMSEVHGFP